MRGKHGGRLHGLFGGRRDRYEDGSPWGSRRRFFESGEVRLALLALLEDGPRHGYELMKELESRSGGTYKASAGTVYPNLQLLEDEALIRAEVPDDGKRVYAITDEGRAELNQNRETIDRIWNRADDWGGWSDAMSPRAMELWGPGKRLLRAAFKTAAKGDDAKVEKVRQYLTEAAEKIEKL